VIRAVIWDWGGVLMRTMDIRPRMAWERRLRLPPGTLADTFFGNPAWDRAQRGEGSVDDVWAEVADRLGVSPADLPALRRDFWAGDWLDEELVGLIRELRSAGIRIGLLSNHLRELRQRLGDLEPLLDAVVISGEVGVLKPDPAIYRLTLDRLGVAPEEAAFVDDWKLNVEAARNLAPLKPAAIIYTDISRDGVKRGVNVAATRTLAEATDIPLIASGGVSSLDDIRSLLPLEPLGVIGVITGRALYDGNLDLKEAIRVAGG